MNTYVKYCPNVFVAKCDSKHEKNETILVTTKYGKENECIVFNQVCKNKQDGFFYYSIVRADGFNRQTWLQKRAERKAQQAANAAAKSNDYWKKSNKDADFLSLGEPIKVGHHSEKRHRKMIEDAQRNTFKAVEYANTAADLQNKADNYQYKVDNYVPNLADPESINYFEDQLAKAEEYHKGVKEGKYPREHAFTLTYAKKAVNELKEKCQIAQELWGD